jgi:antibiotic biosynthesis monooxygenase (ABM) superfamily enzyme
MELAELHESSGPVTAVFSRRIKPGQAEVFEQWLREITARAAIMPGYLGATVLRPTDPAHPEYVTILRFASYAELAAWEQDPERAALMRRAEAIAADPLQAARSLGMELWFTPSGPPPAKPPAKWKMALVLSLAIYLLAETVPRVLAPVLGMLPGPIATFLVVGVNVSLVVWLVIPQVTRRLAKWLFA